MKRTWMWSALACALAFPAGLAVAADQDKVQDRQQTQDRVQTQSTQQIYGSQLMTRQERYEYRVKMRTAKTAEEREQIRLEHHEKMQERARERGVQLPDMPPATGGGMGPGGGYGGGMGPGGGMGAGGGMGGSRR